MTLPLPPDDNVRVLIAEDDYLVSEMIRGLLDEIGHEVVGKANDGLAAVEMTASLRPDVVLMDIKMPEIDGLEAAARIYERHPTPIVVLTAYETQDLVAQASRVGVGAYLVKPPHRHELERAITIAIARFNDLMALQRLNRELKTRNEELDTFAYTVAHDLKNLLTHVVGFSATLKEDLETLTQDQLHHYLSRILKSSQKMGDILDSLLLLSGVRQQVVDRTPLNMHRIVGEALYRMEQMIEEQNAEILRPIRWPQAMGYSPWVEEVWVNYISNAIKYGGHPPRIELGANPQPNGQIRFWARDNGPGIPHEAQKRLFTPFTRLNQADIKGYGLGLSIVRRIVDRLGGTVGLESEPGQGSLFFFTLPKANEDDTP